MARPISLWGGLSFPGILWNLARLQVFCFFSLWHCWHPQRPSSIIIWSTSLILLAKQDAGKECYKMRFLMSNKPQNQINVSFYVNLASCNHQCWQYTIAFNEYLHFMVSLFIKLPNTTSPAAEAKSRKCAPDEDWGWSLSVSTMSEAEET